MKISTRAARPRRIRALLFTLAAALFATASPAADGKLSLTPLRGGIYVVEDSVFNKENSVVYVGRESVTVTGATMTPETAARLAAEISKVTSKPITEVANTNYHPDRAGGNHWSPIHGPELLDQYLDLLAEQPK
jgi:metallo-beta-lactamase class B